MIAGRATNTNGNDRSWRIADIRAVHQIEDLSVGVDAMVTTTMKKSKSAAKEGIQTRGDWRGEMLGRIRALIKQADPDVVEESKWKKPSNPAGVPVWSRAGIICTGETYKDKVKLTFANGASLEDPSGLFNSSLEGNTRRAIDVHEGDKLDEKALKALIRAAVALNTARASARPVRSQKKPKSV
jgi:hypothetical protein